jgi:predicted ArsR family transcriptional regulator
MKRNGNSAAAADGTTPQDGSTRQTIVTLLKTKGPGNARELSKHLGMTEMGVRRHLHALEREGFVRPTLVRQAMGRPTMVYALTGEAEQLFPRNYHLLTLDLLDELEDDPESAGMAGRLFEARKRKLLERYAPRMEGKTLSDRVTELAAIQNAGGYMVEVETGEHGEHVLNEYNCPIAQVASRYQQACSCELALFEKLLNAPVERTECLAKGGNKCSYRITQTL